MHFDSLKICSCVLAASVDGIDPTCEACSYDRSTSSRPSSHHSVVRESPQVSMLGQDEESRNGAISAVEAEDSKDPTWQEPPSPPPKSDTFTLTFNKSDFIDKMVPAAEWNQLSVRGLAEILQELIINGGEDPFDLHVSKSTVERHVSSCRDSAEQKFHSQRPGGKLFLHYNGVRVELGPMQGGQKVEHICITSTGVFGEYKVGIVIAENGTCKMRHI